ncbi:MAG: exo-alpha-sialidase [Verrucomicrobiales bacterium]|nr:exo-alpha-sialidase [Verrucomicrobiales bacterium]
MSLSPLPQVVLSLLGLALTSISAAGASKNSDGGRAELVECRKIWDGAPHNAFTDLVRFRGQWFCVFREGQGHVSPDGAVQVLVSKDGERWTSAARITSPRGDLRDPKIVVAPGGRLWLSAAIALPKPSPVSHQTVAWFSKDGRAWSEPVDIGDPNVWLWRAAWRGKEALGIGYDTVGENYVRLYRSEDGQRFETLLPRLFDAGHPNETGIAFRPDRTAVCLLRRDGEPGAGQVGVAKPPYTHWVWKDLGVRIGGPQLIRLPDGREVGAVRLYDNKVRTSLVWVDADAGKITEMLALPSGGDTSYPGLAWHRGLLWVSYYSSHEGKTAIYLAKVRLPKR